MRNLKTTIHVASGLARELSRHWFLYKLNHKKNTIVKKRVWGGHRYLNVHLYLCSLIQLGDLRSGAYLASIEPEILQWIAEFKS